MRGMIIATPKLFSKLNASHEFSAYWVWKVMVFSAWHVVMDADGNLGLVDKLNAPINCSDFGKLFEAVE